MIMSSELYGSVMRPLRGYMSIMGSRVGDVRASGDGSPPGEGELL